MTDVLLGEPKGPVKLSLSFHLKKILRFYIWTSFSYEEVPVQLQLELGDAAHPFPAADIAAIPSETYHKKHS